MIESYAIANVCFTLKRLAEKYDVPILMSHSIYLGDINRYPHIEAKKIPGAIISNVDNFYYMQKDDSYEGEYNEKINFLCVKQSNCINGISLDYYKNKWGGDIYEKV